MSSVHGGFPEGRAVSSEQFPDPPTEFRPPTYRQQNIDYAVCQALNGPTMRGVIRVLLIYDIMCRWWTNFLARVDNSPFLDLSPTLEISRGIGDLHVKGHVKGCLTRYGLSYIEGAGIIDGEILETLWSVLNESSRSTRGATLAHRGEILDDHMNHSNWKKVVGIGMSSFLHCEVAKISMRTDSCNSYTQMEACSGFFHRCC